MNVVPDTPVAGLIAMAFFFSASFLRTFAGEPPTLDDVLKPIRAQYNLPALAGAIFTTDGVVEMGAVGVRKVGTTIPVTTADLWHLGSDTKAMTSTLAGTFVAQGKLAWDAKAVSFFPEVVDKVPAAMCEVTLGQLLSHRAGLDVNLKWRALSKGGSLNDQRLVAADLALMSPAYAPGTFHYSNTGYVVVGAILEKIGVMPWEELMRERVFGPLGMTSAGFGGTGTVSQIDQPWPHLQTGIPASANGPSTDNPEILGPAGTAHCSMGDWAKFLVDQLRGACGMKALLPNEIYRQIQTPAPGADYAYGWIVVQRPWAGGRALSHAGSNTMNFCVCWLAPAKKFGVLICTNQAGASAEKAGDDVTSALIRRYLAGAKSVP